jgi:hypothetical protein
VKPTAAVAGTISERLGLPEEAVRAVQRHGYLWWLELGDAEIRERLWRAQLTHARRGARRRAHRFGSG